MSKEDLGAISLFANSKDTDEQYSREYRLDEEVAIEGIVTAVSGHVRHDGDGAFLSLQRDGIIMTHARERFGDPTLTRDLVHQWRVTVQPAGDGLLPTSYMMHNLNSASDEAARLVVGEAIGYYQQQEAGN